jgi:hypothetical protein
MLKKLKNILKKIVNFIYDLTIVKIMMIICPIITTPYYLCLDIYGNELNFIKTHPEFHKYAFCICLIIGGCGALLIALHEFLNKKNFRHQHDILECFNKVVLLKKKRFIDKLNNIFPNSRVFQIITHPKDQITQSSIEYRSLLSKIFDIPVEDIDITIIDYLLDPPNYLFKNRQNVKHTDPVHLLSEKSVAAECKKQGIYVYIADKIKASSENKYYLSNSDKAKPGGSAFCYPVIINGERIKAQYLITITTYGRKFSDSPYEIDENETQMILKNIAERIELELELQSMKNYLDQKQGTETAVSKKQKKTPKK